VQRDLLFPENDPVSPTAAITGLFTIGGLANFPQGRVTDNYQFSNTLAWTKNRHTLKFGADVQLRRQRPELGPPHHHAEREVHLVVRPPLA